MKQAFSLLPVGRLPHGKRNLISDVPGVRVGHCTVDADGCHTGVTVVMPPCRNPFADKLTAASAVFNGYGKTLGLVQVDELGTLETPIALTNTLNVGKVHDALVGYMIDLCARDGIALTSVNPVVCECNDSRISDIARRPVGETEVRKAIESASAFTLSSLESFPEYTKALMQRAAASASISIIMSISKRVRDVLFFIFALLSNRNISYLLFRRRQALP